MATRDDPLRRFCDRPIADFNPPRGIGKTPESAYRFNLLQYDPEWRDDWRALLKDPRACLLHALVLQVVHENIPGDAGYQQGEDAVELIVQAREQLAALRGVFLDDTAAAAPASTGARHLGRILETYHELEALGARAGVGGTFEEGIRHTSLRQLICELDAGSEHPLPIAMSQFPALEHLELWMSSRNRQYQSKPTDLKTVFSGDQFPHLTYLGLRDCANAGEYLAALIDAPILEQLETLDLSWGGLRDADCLPVLKCPLFTRLHRLDLRGNRLTRGMISRLKKSKIKVDGDDQRKDSKYVPPDDPDEVRYGEIRE